MLGNKAAGLFDRSRLLMLRHRHPVLLDGSRGLRLRTPHWAKPLLNAEKNPSPHVLSLG
jgi:hypothetical protein